MNIRRIEVNDLVKVHTCNLHNLPENYPVRFWAYVIFSWPGLSFLAEDEGGKVVGYVLSSIEPAENDPHTEVGYINSLSVLRPYRRLGLAQKLMNMTKDAMMRTNTTIKYLQLHVRVSNRAARSLYNKLGYRYHHIDAKYYTDGEDGLVMRFQIQSRNPPEEQERPMSDTRKRTLSWTANFWHFVRDKPHRFAEATMAFLRRNSHT